MVDTVAEQMLDSSGLKLSQENRVGESFILKCKQREDPDQ